MYAEILSILAPVFICAAIGYGWALSGTPFDSDFVTRLVMNISAPCLIVGTLAAVDMPARHFTDIAAATVLVLVLNLFVFSILCRLFHLPLATFLAPLSFPNTGNMGLPLALFAFGEEGLAVALGMFMLMSMTHFSLGVALLSGRTGARDLICSPIVFAAVLSVLLVYTQSTLPLWLENTLVLVGGMSIPLMLLTLGVSLQRLRVSDVLLSTGLAIARLVPGLLIGLVVVWLLELQGVMRGVVLIQAAMPAAVFSYLLAQRYRRAPELIAGMVVISTGFSFLMLPALLWLAL